MFSRLLFFFSVDQVIWPRLNDLIVSQNLKEYCASHFSGRNLGCDYTTCSHGQILYSCSIPSGSPCPLSCISSYTLFTLIYSIRLLCNWFFHFYHHLIYISCFVASYFFLLWYHWSLWHCFLLLSEDIQFLSWSFTFLAISKSSRVRLHLSLEISIQLCNVEFYSDLKR